jgi:D-sedoheptulose 7-phosphate isomerase
MNSTQLLSEKVNTLQDLLSNLIDEHGAEFETCAKIFADTLRNGNTIFWCGNGGSASESSHLAVELIGRFKNNRNPLPSISLNSDSTAITCIANDFGYDQIFSRQLDGLAKPGDLLVALSTSGKSENIANVLKMARSKGVTSISLLGKGGGTALKISDHSILVKSDETARIQEIHLLIGHTFCEFAEISLGLANLKN